VRASPAYAEFRMGLYNWPVDMTSHQEKPNRSRSKAQKTSNNHPEKGNRRESKLAESCCAHGKSTRMRQGHNART